MLKAFVISIIIFAIFAKFERNQLVGFFNVFWIMQQILMTEGESLLRMFSKVRQI